METTLNAFRELIRKIKNYEEAVSVMHWDMRTGAPRKGIGTRSEVVGMLSSEMFRLSISDEMGRYLEQLGTAGTWDKLDEANRKLVEETRKEYERARKIPPEMYHDYVVLTAQAEAVWEEAKPKSDFAAFRPYLEKIVEFNRNFTDLWGWQGHPYNSLLDLYEPGMTVDQLDRVFDELRRAVVPIVHEIGRRGGEDDSFLKQPFDIVKQREFSLYILRGMGYDFEAGRLDESEHPFATGLNPGDVRITTKFKPDDVAFALMGTIHEGGHALYEQNISAELEGTTLCTGASMGIHESQSRFWEIHVGSSLPFWRYYYGKLQQLFPEQLGGVGVERFVRAINRAKPSLIRIEADELTYNLHVMVRYELEKGLIGGDIAVNELPALWNGKYREYLGVQPANDREGVLQDVHWSGGSFGYFPSYTLGNMYAAQLMQALRRQMPDLDAKMERGELRPIKQWLGGNVHRFGKLLSPAEIMLRATGEPPNPAHLIRHLQEKYGQDEFPRT